MKIINMYKCQICGNIIEEMVDEDEYMSVWGYVNHKAINMIPETNRLCVPDDRNHIGVAYYIGSKEAEEVDALSCRYREEHRPLTLEERREYLCINLFDDRDFILHPGKLIDTDSQYTYVIERLEDVLSSAEQLHRPVAFGLFKRELYGMDIDTVTTIIKNLLKNFDCEVLICDDFHYIG